MRLIDAEQYRKEFLDSRDFEPMKILDFQPTIKAIPLAKVEQAREEIANKYDDLANAWCEREEGKNEAILNVLEILDKLIEKSEENK